MKVVHAAAYPLQDENLKFEVYKLHRKVAEQEKKLYSMARRLYSTNQLKENMERIHIDQLALMHNILKKARGNLEVQPSDNKATPSSLIKKRMMKFAWDNYKQFALGKNELRPLTRNGHIGNMFDIKPIYTFSFSQKGLDLAVFHKDSSVTVQATDYMKDEG
ncbi:hypothetical protein E2320_000389 [Naja naja]|nr:hypothetical protein E2320_000389 [Naja naja]